MCQCVLVLERTSYMCQCVLVLEEDVLQVPVCPGVRGGRPTSACVRCRLGCWRCWAAQCEGCAVFCNNQFVERPVEASQSVRDYQTVRPCTSGRRHTHSDRTVSSLEAFLLRTRHFHRPNISVNSSFKATVLTKNLMGYDIPLVSEKNLDFFLTKW